MAMAIIVSITVTAISISPIGGTPTMDTVMPTMTHGPAYDAPLLARFGPGSTVGACSARVLPRAD